MDCTRGVKWIQQVLLGLYMSKVPLRAAVNDLTAAMQEPEAIEDLDGVLEIWRRVISEPILPTRVHYTVTKMVESRAQTALRLAREQGKITSTALAAELGVSQETARQQLVALADRHQLMPVGEWKGRYYVIPGRDRTLGRNLGEGVAAGE